MSFKLSLQNIILFAFIWLCIGFLLGSAILLGPVRWVVNFAKSNNFSQNTESILIKVLMIVFILVSFIIAYVCTSKTIYYQSFKYKILIPIYCCRMWNYCFVFFIKSNYPKLFYFAKKGCGK